MNAEPVRRLVVLLGASPRDGTLSGTRPRGADCGIRGAGRRRGVGEAWRRSVGEGRRVRVGIGENTAWRRLLGIGCAGTSTPARG